MGIRHFILPPVKMEVDPSGGEWENLTNRFAGKILFRKKLYYLETGDLSVIDNIRNPWFYEELFVYALAFNDRNLLPALRKIASSEQSDDDIRNRASEIAGKIALWENADEMPQAKDTRADGFARAENARRTLAGSRYPQTTEILKLLKDNSPELKRLALFLIGKFRMTDMIQEVCECLNISGIEEDVYAVMRSLGPDVVRDIDRCYLKTAGNVNTSKVLLRLMSEIHRPDDMSFLIERLLSNSRPVKEMSLDILFSSGYILTKSERERLKPTITETFGTLAWMISMLAAMEDGKNEFLTHQLTREYERWKLYLLRILHLVYKGKVEEDGNNPIPELSSLIYGNTDRNTEWKKLLKKLRPWYPIELPSPAMLSEDIINCDYNVLGVWIKACTLRCITLIEDANLRESVAALLFSPEQILREEAARLLARTSMELYNSTASRIPDRNRTHLDRMVSGQINEKELLFEKIKFLVSCFDKIKEDELLFLAEKMSFARNNQRGIFSQPSNSIMWSFTEDNSEPEIFVNHEDMSDPGRVARDIRSTCYYCYVLPLKSISEFDFNFPESSFELFRYIDKHEG